jgi:hypothetical protein
VGTIGILANHEKPSSFREETTTQKQPMTSQVKPEEFSSAHQDGDETITVTLAIQADMLANIRAVSYALGLSVEQGG